MHKQRWRISGKPSFRLAVVANERINSGCAQREKEAFQALQTVGAECLDEYGGFLGRQSRCHFSITVFRQIYIPLPIYHLKEVFLMLSSN